MEHELKTLPQYWDAVQRGDKTFEVRRDDRGFQRGDILKLIRHSGQNVAYRQDLPCAGAGNRYEKSSYTLTRRISYILTGGQFGIEPGYVVMGLAPVEATDEA